MSLLSFGRPKPPDPPPAQKSYGLFTVSAGDVIISRPLFEFLVQVLRRGSEEAKALAHDLENVTKGMY